jgi:hypothetical protein
VNNWLVWLIALVGFPGNRAHLRNKLEECMVKRLRLERQLVGLGKESGVGIGYGYQHS